MNDLQTALDATAENAPHYQKAAKYMDGTVTESFASAVMARLLKGSANKFRINYARVPVVKVCNRLKIAAIGVDGDEQASAYVREVWRANQLENLYREIHLAAGGSGSAYLMAWPDPDDPAGKAVDVSMADPVTTRMFYSPENPRKAIFACRIWTEGKATRVNLYYPDRIEKWVTKPRAQGKTAASFEPYVDVYEDVAAEDGTVEISPVWPIPNPYGRIPIFHFKVSAGYGRPLNKDAWEPQDAINKLTSTMMGTVDYQGFPQRYALENADKDPLADADDWGEGDVDTTKPGVTDADDTKGLKAGPGGLWFLNAREVGQFDAADPKSFLEPLNQYVKAISTTTETPLHAFHGMGDAPSGESLRAANAPLNDNALNTAGWLEPTWLAFLDFLLDIGGYEGTTSMVWAKPEQADDKDFWESVTTKISAGVPTHVALEEAGYDPARIKDWGLAPDPAPGA